MDALDRPVVASMSHATHILITILAFLAAFTRILPENCVFSYHLVVIIPTFLFENKKNVRI